MNLTRNAFIYFSCYFDTNQGHSDRFKWCIVQTEASPGKPTVRGHVYWFSRAFLALVAFVRAFVTKFTFDFNFCFVFCSDIYYHVITNVNHDNHVTPSLILSCSIQMY